MTIVFVNRHLNLVHTSQYFDLVLVPERFDNGYSTLSGDFDILCLLASFGLYNNLGFSQSYIFQVDFFILHCFMGLANKVQT